MATTQVRYATIARLKTLFETNATNADATRPVLLALGFPGSDYLNPEHAYVVRNDGQHSITAFSARTPRTDEFTVQIEIQAAVDGQDDTVAFQRAEQIFGFFENAVADNPNTLGSVDGLKLAQITRVDGPFVIGGNAGWKGYLNFDVSCVADMT